MVKKIYDKKILIGKTLKDTRKSLGLTQEEVSETLGLAPRYISDIERDKTKGSIDTLVKLCNLYHVTPTHILKDFLNTSDPKSDDSISGFYNLNNKEKDIVRNLIQYMNKNRLLKKRNAQKKNNLK